MAEKVGKLVSCAVDVYMLSSAAYYDFIMFYIETWLYIDLLITRETNCRDRHNFQDPCD